VPSISASDGSTRRKGNGPAQRKIIDMTQMMAEAEAAEAESKRAEAGPKHEYTDADRARALALILKRTGMKIPVDQASDA
jgi:hypothetical protein